MGIDFFQVHLDQCAVGMIENLAGIYVNFGGMMVTGFCHQGKLKGPSSNPGVTLVFLFRPM
jgi:hypothetical protein